MMKRWILAAALLLMCAPQAQADTCREGVKKRCNHKKSQAFAGCFRSLDRCKSAISSTYKKCMSCYSRCEAAKGRCVMRETTSAGRSACLARAVTCKRNCRRTHRVCNSAQKTDKENKCKRQYRQCKNAAKGRARICRLNGFARCK